MSFLSFVISEQSLFCSNAFATISYVFGGVHGENSDLFWAPCFWEYIFGSYLWADWKLLELCKITIFIELFSDDQDKQKLIMRHNKLKILVAFIIFCWKILLIFHHLLFRHKKTFCFLKQVSKVYFYKQYWDIYIFFPY